MMIATATLAHWTLTSGHVRQSPRSEVHPGILALLGPLLERMLVGERVPVPGFERFTMSGGAAGDCLAVTVWTTTATGERVPVVTFGTARFNGGDADALWRDLHTSCAVPPATSPGIVPGAPWCAARLEPGAALVPDDLSWAADLERCVSWAWLAR